VGREPQVRASGRLSAVGASGTWTHGQLPVVGASGTWTHGQLPVVGALGERAPM